MRLQSCIVTDFHHMITLTRRDMRAALRETARDFDGRAALREAQQIIDALLDALRKRGAERRALYQEAR